MKTKLYLIAIVAIIVQVTIKGQAPANQAIEYTTEYWEAYVNKLNLNAAEKAEFLKAKRDERLQAPKTNILSPTPSNFKSIVNQNNLTQALGCNNIDFEVGSTQGWSLSCGFHPLFNPMGCCPNPGGQQLIVSGNTATDPFGGFPLVAPGGNFSLRLGDSNIGGQADQISQTFFVTAANANFTYKYAVVLEDPGHIQSEQPAFVVQMFDTSNTAIPCTYYNVSAGQNIPGFFNAANSVVYKPWTSVVVDLSNYIGQNVTITFTTYDCALGGHFGYAYIDGNCAAFITGNSDSLCVGGSKTICGPTGFGSYTWNGPNTNNVTTQCLNVTAAGVYTCSTTLVTSCPGPQFTYTMSNFANPNVSFIPQTTSPCALQYTFANNSSISQGNIVSYNWDLGNTLTSSVVNANTIYSTYGTYQVSLTATSDHSCVNTAVNTITIYPNPVALFNGNTVCQNSLITFTNASTIPTGSITNYFWNFGANQTSTLINPNHQYSTSGNFVVSLVATSNQGCTTTYTNQVTVNPIPNVNFNAANACMGQANNFANLSTISSGNIANYIWNFNNFNTSTSINPSYVFPASGTYNVQLTAISDNNCINTIIKPVLVNAIPVADFSVPNVCANSALSIINTSSVQNAYLNTYLWTFNSNAVSFVANPIYTYNTPGTYTIGLMVYSNYSCSASTSKTISVFAVPQVNFSSNVTCLNQTTQFNNSTIISNGNITKWRWDFQNDGNWDDTISVNPNLVYPTYGNFNCRLVAVSNHNCVSSIINPVVVHPNPIAEFKANSACLGDITNFVNLSSSPAGAITSYQWQYYGDGNVSNIFANAAYTYSFAGTFLVKLEVQNEYGCTNVKSKSVYVNPRPVANFVSNKPKGCELLCVNFTNQSSIAAGKIITNQWLFGDGSAPSYSLNPTHCFNSGKFDVTLKLSSDSGCITTFVDHAAIEVYPKPVASFITVPEDLDDLDPSVNVTSNAINADETRYYINDGSTYLTNNFSHTFTNTDKQKPIIFQVVTSKHGCSDTTSRILKINQSFAIYIPNTFTPNDDGTNDGFKALGYNITKFNMQIFDRWGKMIFETNDMNVAWDGHMKGSDEPIKDDVYVWKANVIDINNKTHDLVGHVTLLK